MNRFLKIFVALIASCLPALAQAPIHQSGNATPGHALYFVTNGIAGDAGTAVNGFLTSLGVTASGDAMCQNSAGPTSAGWQRICFGVTTAAGADITVQNFGTAIGQPLTLNLNGTAYQFPFTPPGTGVIGPNTTVSGNFVEWNNTTGTLVKDAGFTTGTSGHAIPFLDGNNTYSLTQIIPEVSAPAATNLVLNTPTGQIIALEVNGTSYVQFSSSALDPTTDNSISLGAAANRWSNIWGVIVTTPNVFGGTATNSTLTLSSTTSGSPSGSNVILAGDIVNVVGVANPAILDVGSLGSFSGQIELANTNGVNNGWTNLIPSASSNINITLPASTDTVVGRATTDTLTNKTIDSSAIGSTTPSTAKVTSLNASGQITSTTGLPTIASGACGATTNGAVVAGSTNQSGSITIGSASTTSCIISWSTTLALAPNACVFFPMNAAAAATGTTVARSGAPTTASVTLTGSALANANYAYICL